MSMDDMDEMDRLIRAAEQPQQLIAAPQPEFPWSKCIRGSHIEAEEQLKMMYESAKLKPPRFAWALSPAALFTAIQMLKTVHAGQRHKFIEAMVPSDDPIASAKRTLLDGITDRTVMTTMGAAQRTRFYPGRGMYQHVYLQDLGGYLHHFDSHTSKNPWKVATPATSIENVIFPAMYHLSSWLPQQVLLFMPYVHICWMCEPPTETLLWPNGHLMMMKFADGYQVTLADPERLDYESAMKLAAEEPSLALPPGTSEDE